MRDNDGRKLDHKTLEALRIRAVDRVGQGAHPEDVVAALGLHRKTVTRGLGLKERRDLKSRSSNRAPHAA